VITCDGRVIVGILEGFDQTFNLILSQSHELIFDLHGPVTVVQLGLYILRGDNVGVIGKIEEELEAELNYEQVRSDPPRSIIH